MSFFGFETCCPVGAGIRYENESDCLALGVANKVVKFAACKTDSIGLVFEAILGVIKRQAAEIFLSADAIPAWGVFLSHVPLTSFLPFWFEVI